MFQICFRDLLSSCAVDLFNHTEVSLCPRPQRPGLDTSVQSARVTCVPLLPVLLPDASLCLFHAHVVSLNFNILRIFALLCLSGSRAMSVWDTCLQITVACTVVGAWVGAFPIPLDWDRPWQVSAHDCWKEILVVSS